MKNLQMLFIYLKMLLSVFLFLLKNIVWGFFNLSEAEHITDTSIYVRANINDVNQHYPDAFYNPAIDRLYRLKEFVEGAAE